jgi:hypothetical protein
MVTPKYKNYCTVSLPPMLWDMMMEQCYATGLTRQDFIRASIRHLISVKLGKDVEAEMMNRLKDMKI